MEDIIIKLRRAYKELGNKKHEESVKLHIIINTFMEYYGYNEKKCIPEEPIVKGFCDIYVPIVGEKALVSNRRLSQVISADYLRRKYLSQSAVNEPKAFYIGWHRRLSRAYFSSAMAGLK